MRKNKIILLSILLYSILLTGCGTKSTGATGYSQISGVDGVVFSIPSNITENATAVTQVDENCQFEPNATYSYKNENSQYLLFNMKSIVVAVQKGTTYDFAKAQDKEAVLTSNSLLGIWFDTPDKKLEYTDKEAEGAYLLKTTVSAEVVLTPDLYENFVGKLVSIQYNDTEWTLFAGTVGTSYDDIDKNAKTVIEEVANSFKIKQNSDNSTEFISVNNDTGNISSGAEDNSVSEPEITVEDPVEENTEPEAAKENDDIVIDVTPEQSEVVTPEEEQPDDADEIIIDMPSTPEEISEPDTKKETENPKEPSSQADVSEEPLEKPSEEPSLENEPVPSVPEEKENIKLDNQKNDTESDSSIYNMSKIGDSSHVVMLVGKQVSTLSFTVSKLYKDDKAIEIIKEYCSKEDTIYDYKDAPSGCSWNVIEYEMSYTNAEGENPYLNIKLVGMDGKNLMYRGISYSKRTHDIVISEVNTNNTVTRKMYCFYPLPNGCTEYALEFGEGTIDNDLDAAYYKIKVEN